jgi:hypothetical protein
MKSRMFVGRVLFALLQAAHGQNYKLLKSIPIGGEGGRDYLANRCESAETLRHAREQNRDCRVCRN